jgi:hypothetical protein
MQGLVKKASALALLGAVGCSSPVETPANVQCGEGTTLVDDTCVVIDGSVGDVATDDARRAEDAADGTVASDAPKDGGGEDATSSDASVVDSADGTPPSDSAIGGDVDAGVDGGGIDVGKDAAEIGIDALAADPCPTKTPDVDCSGMCGGPSTMCVPRYTCNGTYGVPPVLITSYSQLPFTIRTPDHPGVDPGCQPRCGVDNIVWGFAIRVEILPFAYDGIKVSVGPGWKIYGYDTSHPFCLSSPSNLGQSCRFDASSQYQVFVGTTDPAAPSRNVHVEFVPKGAPRCP